VSGDEHEVDRLRRELSAVEGERRRLVAELEQIRRSPLGPLIGPARTLRAIVERRMLALRRRLGGGRIRVKRGRGADDDRDRRLPPSLSGSELVWLARRRLRSRTSRWAPGEPAPPAGEWLTPILVDYFGRDGSTAMMSLLASAPEIVIDEKYPYERRYFTYLWRWSRLLSRTDWPDALWGKDDVVSIAQESEGSTLLGPPPWLPRELLEAGDDGSPIAQRCFELAWAELSARAGVRAGDPQAPRYYAEKHGNTWLVDLRDLPPLKLIVLLRDPRDGYASIRAFEDKEPATSFGIQDTRAGADRLGGILDRHRRRLRWIAELLADESVPVIRYEELVGDPDGVARRLERHLEVELDPDALRNSELSARHGSSPTNGSGRWRSELDPETAGRFARELGPELAAVGFEA